MYFGAESGGVSFAIEKVVPSGNPPTPHPFFFFRWLRKKMVTKPRETVSVVYLACLRGVQTSSFVYGLLTSCLAKIPFLPVLGIRERKAQ